MNSKVNVLPGQNLMLKMFVASVLMLILAAGCTSTPSVTPEKLAMNFIQKNIPMIDPSVADFYVKEEQSWIEDRVKANIASNKEKGLFKSLSAAKYDYSKIKVNILDQKEEYFQDEEMKFLKVGVTGNYTMTANGKTQSLAEDEVIIMQSVAGVWKVTEKIDPWNL